MTRDQKTQPHRLYICLERDSIHVNEIGVKIIIKCNYKKKQVVFNYFVFPKILWSLANKIDIHLVNKYKIKI